MNPVFAGRHFVVVGAGGLGCPALLGLAAAGVRQITIVDDDVVDASNLARQVLYRQADVGTAKVDAARGSLVARHPDIDVRPLRQRLDPSGADVFVRSLEDDAIVLECSDQPALKFAANDAVMRHGRRAVIGAALGLQAQVLALAPGHACYRCIYEQPPAHTPSCDGAGVLGPAVGMAGFLMANRALRLADDAPETAGRLTAIDTLRGTVVELSPKPRRTCAGCSLGSASALPTPTDSSWGPHVPTR